MLLNNEIENYNNDGKKWVAHDNNIKFKAQTVIKLLRLVVSLDSLIEKCSILHFMTLRHYERSQYEGKEGSSNRVEQDNE